MTAMVKRSYKSPVHRKQRSKNLAMLIALLGFVVLVYLVSVVRIGAAETWTSARHPSTRPSGATPAPAWC